MSDLKQLFNFYLEHQAELVKLYNGKYIVLKDNEVVNSFDSAAEAYFDSEKKYGLGNFLIQLCTEGDEAYTQRFTSRVKFA